MYFLSLMQGNMHSLSHSVTSNSFVTPWTAACQAPLSMGFYRQEYWCGVSFPSSGDRLEPGIEPGSHALQEDSLLSESPGFETLSWGKRRALIQNGLVWISRMPFPSWKCDLGKGILSGPLFVHLWSGENATLFCLSGSIYHVYRWYMKNVFQRSLFSKSVHLGRQNI